MCRVTQSVTKEALVQTVIRINDPQAVKVWATKLAVATNAKIYWNRFIGEGENNIIQQKTELEDGPGDTIRFDLTVPLKGDMVYGDNRVEGTEENLVFYQDEVYIDQARKAASAGGRMSRKRTIHNLREIAKNAASDYVAQWHDDLCFTYMSGDASFEATNPDNKVRAAFAGNPVQAPDVDHILYGGAAKAKAELTTADKMSTRLIERAALKPAMMAQVNPDVVRMAPVAVEGGEARYVLLMSPFNGFDLRTESGDTGWVRIQQALATSEGRKSPICKGGLGMVAGTILHEHEKVRLFNGYGAGADVRASRSLLLGRQAGVMAYGGMGRKTRFSWVEKKADADNLVNIYPGLIAGMKKVRYNQKDFGVISIDTAYSDPNALAA